VAEGVGFEPTGRLHAQRFSRPPLSAAQPSLRVVYFTMKSLCFQGKAARRDRRGTKHPANSQFYGINNQKGYSGSFGCGSVSFVASAEVILDAWREIEVPPPGA
jgi:hypothetical protein